MIPKFNYQDYTVENPETGRKYYSVPDYGYLPGVTKILGATEDPEKKKILEDWRARVGEKEAERITKESTDLGKAMHTNIENYVLHKQKPQGQLMAKLLSEMIIKYGIDRLDEIWGIEAQVYYPELWFGIIDLIGIHRGELAVIDFKNSKQMKKEEWLIDYKIQLASYIMAHNKLYGTNIKKGVIMMASRDGKYKEFILQGDQLESLSQVWLQKVYQYYDNKLQ